MRCGAFFVPEMRARGRGVATSASAGFLAADKRVEQVKGMNVAAVPADELSGDFRHDRRRGKEIKRAMGAVRSAAWTAGRCMPFLRVCGEG